MLCLVALLVAWSFDALFWQKPFGISFPLFILLVIAGGLLLTWQARETDSSRPPFASLILAAGGTRLRAAAFPEARAAERPAGGGAGFVRAGAGLDHLAGRWLVEIFDERCFPERAALALFDLYRPAAPGEPGQLEQESWRRGRGRWRRGNGCRGWRRVAEAPGRQGEPVRPAARVAAGAAGAALTGQLAGGGRPNLQTRSAAPAGLPGDRRPARVNVSDRIHPDDRLPAGWRLPVRPAAQPSGEAAPGG